MVRLEKLFIPAVALAAAASGLVGGCSGQALGGLAALSPNASPEVGQVDSRGMRTIVSQNQNNKTSLSETTTLKNNIHSDLIKSDISRNNNKRFNNNNKRIQTNETTINPKIPTSEKVPRDDHLLLIDDDESLTNRTLIDFKKSQQLASQQQLTSFVKRVAHQSATPRARARSSDDLTEETINRNFHHQRYVQAADLGTVADSVLASTHKSSIPFFASGNHGHLVSSSLLPMMISKSSNGYYVLNNITLKTCRDVLKPQNVDRCTLTDYIEDCVTEEGSIDYVAFFFCAFSPDKMPIALVISMIWLLMLFVATGVTATDFLCPALFMISKTLGLSQNIAGVTFLAFGNMSADIFAAINGIRMGKPDLVISVICGKNTQTSSHTTFRYLGSGTMITTMIIGCVFFVKQFHFDKMIFIRDLGFYIATVILIMYIFMVPGRIRLQDSISLLGLYLIYVIVVLISKYFSNDKPLKDLHGKNEADGDTIEFEGVHVDDDPNASMVVMRRFLFLSDDNPPFKPPTFKLDKASLAGDSASGNGIILSDNNNTLTTRTNKSARRVTLFEENLFSGVDSLSPDSISHQTGHRRSRSTSIMSISKHQLVNLRRASRDIRRQSMDFLVAVSPIDPNVWRQENWGGRTMELVKAPIRLFLLITTPMADIDGKHEWNKPLSVLHCITGPIFVSYAFGFGSFLVGPLTVPVWLFIIMAPMSTIIIFTSSSETPPFYYNAYSSYLGFIVAITWIYTISSEVINLLRAIGIAFDLSSEIMGLTVLAWGNCMLDFITNISIARKGLPKMAVAACYGGPLMSHLLGIGLPSLVVLLLNPNHPTTLGSSPLIYLMFAFLLFGLISTLLIVIFMKFRASKNLGICLIVLYLFMAICAWLTELRIIRFDLLFPGLFLVK